MEHGASFIVVVVVDGAVEGVDVRAGGGVRIVVIVVVLVGFGVGDRVGGVGR